MSNKLLVNTDSLLQAADGFSKLESSLEGISQQIMSALSATRNAAPTQYAIINSVSSLQKRVNSASSQAGKLSSNIGKATAMWADCEKKLAGLSMNTSGEAVTGQGSGSKENSSSFFKNFFQKWIGSCGPIGSAVSTIWKVIEKPNWKTILTGVTDVGGSLAKFLTKYIKGNADKGSIWKNLVGNTAKKYTPTSATWSGKFCETFSSKFADGLSNPISWITSGIKSVINNVSEVIDGKITWDRGVVEGIVETGAGVAVGAAATAAATGILIACGVAAPAGIAVAAVAAGITVAADWVTKKITKAICGTEYGIVEGVGHVVGEIYDGGKKLISAAADVVSSAKKSVAKWASGVFGAIFA